MRHAFLHSLAFFALLIFAGSAWADRVVLKSGRVIEGSVSRDGGQLTVTKANGIKATFDAALVDRVEVGETSAEEYKRRQGEARDAAQHKALARWCVAKKLRRQAKREWQAVIALSPDDREAREALGYTFTKRGWMTRGEYMRGLGFVKRAGRWVPKAESTKRDAAQELKKQQRRVRRLLTQAVGASGEKRKAARVELRGMPDAAALKPFKAAMFASTRKARAVLIDELRQRKAPGEFSKLLAKAAIGDPSRRLRTAALEALSERQDPSTAMHFAKYLDHKDPIARINATGALMRFPDRRVVGRLIKTLRYAASGFGRSYSQFTTQRAYIKDFELASGGTGLRVSEVADPVIGSFSEGVVLDVKVRRVEWESKVHVLEYLTGQSFGTNQQAWVRWWKKERESFALRGAPLSERKRFLAAR